MFREGLAGLVDAMPGLRVVGKAASGAEALAVAAAEQPDVLVMDLHMPGMNGIEATSRVVRERPGTAMIFAKLHVESRAAAVAAARDAGLGAAST